MKQFDSAAKTVTSSSQKKKKRPDIQGCFSKLEFYPAYINTSIEEFIISDSKEHLSP